MIKKKSCDQTYINIIMEEPDFYSNLTTEASKEIKPIDKATVHRICSGQVVLNLAIAMKELVENSVDAGATSINIHLKEYGLDLVEVSDNGCGVHPDNFKALTMKHCTSKLIEFKDLENLSTLGFRGEALSSLCALADIEICTKHSSAEIATKLKYDNCGNIVSETLTAREQGTTVTLKNLFHTLPVRKKQFTTNLKKEFTKLCNLLYAYCLLPNGIKFTCTNATKGMTNSVVVTQGGCSIRENVISVFGVKQLASLIDVAILKPDLNIVDEYSLKFSSDVDELPFDIVFMISNALHGSARSSSDRQFFYINNRPCEPSKVMKLVNSLYRQFNNKQYPFVYLNITTKGCLVDVNVTPDKRQVFLEQENLLLATIKTSILEAFKDCPSTLKVQNVDVSRDLKRPLLNDSKEEPFNKKPKVSNHKNFLDRFMKKPSNETISCRVSMEDIKSSQDEADVKLEQLISIANELLEDDEVAKNEKQPTEVLEKSIERLEKDISPTILDISIDNKVETKRQEIPLKIDIETLRNKFKTKLDLSIAENETQQIKFRSEIAPESNQTAEDELNRHISKSDFSQMQIVGQFNKGFIITRLVDDLFIIDQHATDEKYNFEQLQANTVIDNQKLVTPKLLELTAAARTTLHAHESVFQKSGFEFQTKDEKIYLTKVPISKSTVFGVSDIDEMIFMLQEDPSQDGICRPTRIRSMFASRACRKSVMIGKALTENEMRRLVDHMGEIEQPWNCPHGRPTMRHLINLSLLADKI